MHRPHLIFALKSILGIALLAVLLFRDDHLSKLIDLFGGFRAGWILPIAGIATLLIVVSCLKWSLFLRERGARVTLPRLMGLYTIGSFFNNFLPGMVGGDVVRGYVLGRQIASQPRSMATVFWERFTGALALVLLCLGTLAVRRDLLRQPIVAASAAAVAAGCVVVALILARPSVARRMLAPLERVPKGKRLLDGLARLHDEAAHVRKRPRVLAAAMVYSFAFHILAGVNTWIAGRAIGVDAPLIGMIALTPLILVVSSVPLTPNGLGIWEWAHSVYLISLGVSPAQGLAIALILRAEAIAASLVGGILFLVEGFPWPDARPAGEPESRERS